MIDVERAAHVLYLQRTAFGGEVSTSNLAVSPDQPERFNLTAAEPILEDVGTLT